LLKVQGNLNFDGVDDYVTAAAINFNSISVEFWAKEILGHISGWFSNFTNNQFMGILFLDSTRLLSF
jgi:hypothetical protein